MRTCRVVTLALLLSALLAAGPARVFAASPSVTVPILMYHHIGATTARMPQAEYYVSGEVFDAQMAYVAQHGYTPVSIDQIVAALEGGQPLPPRPIAITFDDGNQDNYDNALPILQKYHLFATFFIVTHWVGTPGHLTWDEIATMQQAGMRFGAHTLTHPYLQRLSAAAASHEIAGSKAELEAHLGRPVTAFAFPYGHTSLVATRLVQAAGFLAALGTSPARMHHTPAELFYLTRIGVYNWTAFKIFVARLSAGSS